MNGHVSIQKHAALNESSDYYLLRQKGVEYITQLGSTWWTDHNLHDPGITIMEALAYAITELGHKTGSDIKDLLATPDGTPFDPSRQGFFTAREILTVNPWTANDFRKLLVDIDGVKNAWLVCRKCPCEMKVYVDCKKSILKYDKPLPPEDAEAHEVFAKGLYDVLLEFDDEGRFGDMNSGKIQHKFIVDIAGDRQLLYLEVRFPSWNELTKKFTEGSDADKKLWKDLASDDSAIDTITVTSISGNKQDNIDITNDKLANALRKPMYATIEVKYTLSGAPVATPVVFEDVPFNLVMVRDAVRKQLTVAQLRIELQNISASGILQRYLDKIKRAKAVVKEVNKQLHSHRNLAEDFCRVEGVDIEEVAICADMEVKPDADIEKILAEAYYLISEYFAPEIKFYSLRELLDAGTPVDEIFEGPALEHGFINTEELEKASLKKVLYTSDIINLLMDIPGVKAIRNLVLVRYNKEGKAVESQPWKLEVTANHQPRLFMEASKFLVFKNNLPFTPDISELMDTLQVIAGSQQHPKLKDHELDLDVPKGKYQDWQEYFPVQYSFPLTYGIGYEGLPSDASDQRKAQAKQLKAYLLFFEQLLVNYLSQLSHAGDLFALDTTVANSYFTRLLTNADIRDVETDIYDGLAPALQGLAETPGVFLDRRNRFLDHMLARFAEEFSDYAMMLYAMHEDRNVANEVLIKDKIAFLKQYPFISANRARSFNYKDEAGVCNSNNVAGLSIRLSALLGYEQYLNFFGFSKADPASPKFMLSSPAKKILLESPVLFRPQDQSPEAPLFRSTAQQMLKFIFTKENYDIKRSTGLKFKVSLLGEGGNVLGVHPELFRTKSEAEALRDEIIAFAGKFLKQEKFYIVEHLLMRPRYKPSQLPPDGDPLLPICVGPDCAFCGDEDPYSFRLTFVMNGESGQAKDNIAFRRFAEDTIRKEVPAHLVTKVCWVREEQFLQFKEVWCAWLKELAKEEPDPQTLSDKLKALIAVFAELRSVYPPASLHDCVDGNDENRVYLGQTVMGKTTFRIEVHNRMHVLQVTGRMNITRQQVFDEFESLLQGTDFETIGSLSDYQVAFMDLLREKKDEVNLKVRSALYKKSQELFEDTGDNVFKDLDAESGVTRQKLLLPATVNSEDWAMEYVMNVTNGIFNIDFKEWFVEKVTYTNPV
ncbi:MAG TPA: hypothetical protein VD996_06110 [Chitinophagaceae bacterium]|nr:hypothetical protein [Chitinophagaceae bacterium]